jgi:hypothetical protein
MSRENQRSAWQIGSVHRPLVAILVGLLLGTLAGLAYATLVGGLHRTVHGRWDRVPTFALGCVAAGAAAGLAIGAGMAFVASPNRPVRTRRDPLTGSRTSGEPFGSRRASPGPLVALTPDLARSTAYFSPDQPGPETDHEMSPPDHPGQPIPARPRPATTQPPAVQQKTAAG